MTMIESDNAGRSGLRREGDRMIGLVRLAIGLFQGIALYLLVRTTEQSLTSTAEAVPASWSSTHPDLFAPLLLTALFLPPVLLAGVGRLRWPTVIVWGVIAAAMTAFLAWYDIVRQAGDMGRQGTPPLFAFSAAALFIAHHLILAADRERRLFAPYPTYFDAAWMAGVQLALSVGFAGAFWVLLFLGAALFKIIGLTFLGDLINERWFSLPLTGLAFATAVHLTDVRDGLIRGVRTIALMLLSWLLLVLTVLVAGFLAALPFTGLDGLWETGRATALILGAAGAMIILINATYQDGREDNLPPLALRITVRIAAVLLTPLIVIAVWGLSLRIGQHGLTPDRIIAAACALVGAAYALGYGLGALVPLIRRGSPWMRALETTNVVVAILVVGVILALFTPLADPARLSVHDQMSRLESGKVAPDKFDYSFLKFHSGKVGQAALARLVQSENPEIARHARKASEAENQYQLEPERPPRVIGSFPATLALPPEFTTQVKPDDLPGCVTAGDCIATLRDMDRDGVEEILVADRSAIHLFAKGAQGWWKTGQYSGVRCQPSESIDYREALRTGRITLIEPRTLDLQIDGRPIVLTPSLDCLGRSLPPAR